MDLRSRLRRLAPPADTAGGNASRPPAAFSVRAADGPQPAFVCRRERFGPEHRHGARPLGHALGLEIEALAALCDAALPADAHGPRLEEVVFVDTETTALGSGAGVYVFLTAVGRFVSGGTFELEQWLLRDPGDERAMLEAIGARIGGAALVVSFGGRGFDERMLADRFRLHGLAPPIARARHADLATVSRALWSGRLGSCRLGALEAAVLGLRRQGDLPGAECPAAYFAWLRAGTPRGFGPIEAVLAHNRDDVLSLPLLAHEITQRARGEAEAHEWLGLGRHWRRRGAWSRAREAFERALGAGTAALRPHERAQALAELGGVYARLGAWREASEAWRPLLSLAAPPVDALIALAKVAEHRLRALDLAERASVAALSALRRGTDPRDARRRQRLEAALRHRLGRLERKRKQLARAASRVPRGSSCKPAPSGRDAISDWG